MEAAAIGVAIGGACTGLAVLVRATAVLVRAVFDGSAHLIRAKRGDPESPTVLGLLAERKGE